MLLTTLAPIAYRICLQIWHCHKSGYEIASYSALNSHLYTLAHTTSRISEQFYTTLSNLFHSPNTLLCSMDAMLTIFLFLCLCKKETGNTHSKDMLLNTMLAAQRLQ